MVKVTRGKLGAPLTLAGAFKPFQDVDVHAKVAGYIKAIYVEVGSRVKQGQTLDVRNSWLDTQKAYARLGVTEQLREQANLAWDLAQARYKLGLSSIVEYSQAELQKTDADLQDTDARYQYRLSQIVLGYQMGERSRPNSRRVLPNRDQSSGCLGRTLKSCALILF